MRWWHHALGHFDQLPAMRVLDRCATCVPQQTTQPENKINKLIETLVQQSKKKSLGAKRPLHFRTPVLLIS
jgi:hypothetical protein